MDQDTPRATPPRIVDMPYRCGRSDGVHLRRLYLADRGDPVPAAVGRGFFAARDDGDAYDMGFCGGWDSIKTLDQTALRGELLAIRIRREMVAA